MENPAEAIPVLDISIVVHGESDFIMGCLDSIYRRTHIPFRVIVVANTGENETIQMVRKAFPQVTVLVNPSPLGYAANHNRVIRQTSSRAIALLNDDLQVGDHALDMLVRFLDDNPPVAIVGPRLLNPDGSLQPSTFGDPTLIKTLLVLLGLNGLLLRSQRSRQLLSRLARPLFPGIFARYWDHSHTADAQVLYGAALVVRRAAVEDVGPMAEISLAYGEEEEWHLRLRKAGWRLCFVPAASMTHFGGQSTGGTVGPMLLEARKATLYYYYQHRSRLEFEVVRATMIVIHLIRWLGSSALAWFGAGSQQDVHHAIWKMAAGWPHGAMFS